MGCPEKERRQKVPAHEISGATRGGGRNGCDTQLRRGKEGAVGGEKQATVRARCEGVGRTSLQTTSPRDAQGDGETVSYSIGSAAEGIGLW